MADILAALDSLENEERVQKKTSQQAARRKPSQSSGRSGGRPRARSTKSHQDNDDLDNLPPPVISTGRLTPIPKNRPRAPSPSRSRESSVGGDSRRISFAEPARPAVRKLYIPTKQKSLASGFAWDPRLQKYGVLEAEWAEFSDEVIDAANVPSSTWAWFLHKNDVTRRIKKELQYEGDFKRVLRKWNKHFKRKGFQAWLELPAEKGAPVRSQSAEPPADSSDEEYEKKSQKDTKKNSKRFRMVVSSSVEKGSSVYSRTSSLTRSVSREAAVVGQGNAQEQAAQKAHANATAHEQDVQEHHEEERRKSAGDADSKPIPALVVDHVDPKTTTNGVEKVDSSDKDDKFANFDSADGDNIAPDQVVEKKEVPTKDYKDDK